MERHWKLYGMGQLDCVLLHLHGGESSGKAAPTVPELAKSLGVSSTNLRGALKALEGYVEVRGSKREARRGLESQTYGVSPKGAARVDAKLRALLDLRFDSVSTPQDALSALAELYA
mgnify:CR=1 FL=1|tara:strand:+ start:717 stop:1067 length:351 start_codon:yes stop_codon:yes gene_type:complete